MNRVYPTASVRVDEVDGSAIERFLRNPGYERIHVTDIDILILPHDISHEEYYGRHMVNGASYLRGATIGHGTEWKEDLARVCGGHASFTQEYYRITKVTRDFFSNPATHVDYREFDEVMLQRILSWNGYPIPEIAYTFPDGEVWDKEFRDLHINDFWGVKFEKWKPDKKKIADLFSEKQFIDLCSNLSPRWMNLISKTARYAKS